MFDIYHTYIVINFFLICLPLRPECSGKRTMLVKKKRRCKQKHWFTGTLSVWFVMFLIYPSHLRHYGPEVVGVSAVPRGHLRKVCFFLLLQSKWWRQLLLTTLHKSKNNKSENKVSIWLLLYVIISFQIDFCCPKSVHCTVRVDALCIQEETMHLVHFLNYHPVVVLWIVTKLFFGIKYT